MASMRKLVLIFSAAVVVSLGLVGAIAYNAQESLSNSRLAKESRDRRLLIERITLDLARAESSLRGFVATEEPVFREEYQYQRDQLDADLVALDLKTFPAAVDPATLTQFLATLAQRLATMDELLSTYQQEGQPAAAETIRSRVGLNLSRAVDAEAQVIAQWEDQWVNQRRDAQDFHATLQVFLLILGALIKLGLLSGAYVLIRDERQRNASILQTLHETVDETATVNALSSALQSCQTRGDTNEVIQHYLVKLFPGMSGALYLMRNSRNLLEINTLWGHQTETLSDRLQPQECWALRLGHTHSVTSEDNAISCRHRPQFSAPTLCIPLLAQSEIVGLLHLEAPDVHSLNQHKSRAELVGIHVSAALGGIALREALHHQSIRDPLTGLYNRRYLEESIERELLRARRGKASIGVLMLDVDHFKRFNDSYGHDMGDRVLKALALYLTKSMRGEDLVCRFGGEELVVVLPGATLQQAAERAERLRTGMASLNVNHSDQATPPVTASFGVAAYPDHGDEWESLLHAADQAMYRAKVNGRNRVEIAPLDHTDDDPALIAETR